MMGNIFNQYLVLAANIKEIKSFVKNDILYKDWGTVVFASQCF